MYGGRVHYGEDDPRESPEEFAPQMLQWLYRNADAVEFPENVLATMTPIEIVETYLRLAE